MNLFLYSSESLQCSDMERLSVHFPSISGAESLSHVSTASPTVKKPTKNTKYIEKTYKKNVPEFQNNKSKLRFLYKFNWYSHWFSCLVYSSIDTFRALLEQFQSSFRAVSVQFKGPFAWLYPEQFQSSFRAVSEQFQSSFSSIQFFNQLIISLEININFILSWFH